VQAWRRRARAAQEALGLLVADEVVRRVVQNGERHRI
jgi:hypothetical protein